MPNSRQATRNQGGMPGWLWLVIGLILGLILAWIVFTTGHAPNLRRGNAPVPNPNASVPAPGQPGIADQTAKQKQRDYDFYTVLPEKEVVIPDAQLSAQAHAAGSAAQVEGGATAPTSGQYLLQVGSFPNADDADALKAKLALQGFEAHIEPVTIDGTTWHRVRLGPYSSVAKLEATKSKLGAAGIKAIALKERN